MKLKIFSTVTRKGLCCILLSVPAIASAQKWHASLSAGVSTMSRPKTLVLFEHSHAEPALAVMVHASRSLSSHLSLGMDVCFTKMRRSEDVSGTDYYGNPVSYKAHYYLANPASLITASLSYHHRGFYIGPQLGAALTTQGPDDEQYTAGNPHFNYRATSGYCAGAHAGYNQKVIKHVELFAEARANVVFGNLDDYFTNASINFSTLQSQAVLGFRFSY